MKVNFDTPINVPTEQWNNLVTYLDLLYDDLAIYLKGNKIWIEEEPGVIGNQVSFNLLSEINREILRYTEFKFA